MLKKEAYRMSIARTLRAMASSCFDIADCVASGDMSTARAMFHITIVGGYFAWLLKKLPEPKK